MRDLYLPDQVQAMDRRAFDRGVDPAELMDRAASFLARGVLAVANRRAGLRVVLLCGKGNNGGDGIAAARHLAERDAEATVVLLAPPEELGADAARELAAWLGQSGRALAVARPGEADSDQPPRLVGVTAANLPDDVDPDLSPEDVMSLVDVVTRADVAVDCLLGTGASGAPRGDYVHAVEVLNRFAGPVVACDIPTGVDGATGATPGAAVRADLTVTLGAHKRGLALSPGSTHAGRVVLGELDVIDGQATPVAHVLEPDDLSVLVPPAEEQAEKRSRGVVVIYAGAEGTSGAAILSARAALRAGAGLVTVAVPAAVAPIVAGAVPEAMTVALPSDQHGIVATIGDLMDRADVLALGPGLGLADQTQRAVRELVGSITTPIVLDADGLNAFRDCSGDLATAPSELLVLTPHVRELSRLTGVSPEELAGKRVDAAREYARRWGATVVAKGPSTVVAARDGQVWINPTGGPALATGGTGDALTGISSALVAQQPAPSSVACAVYLHGLAGDLSGQSIGVRATTAGTVIEHLGAAATTVGI